MMRWKSKSVAHNFTGTLDGLSFLDKPIRPEQHNTDLTSFQVQAHALDTRCEPGQTYEQFFLIDMPVIAIGNSLNQFFGLNISQTVDSCNTVTDCEYLV